MRSKLVNIRQSLKTREFKVFFGFFVLSLFFWLFTKMSQVYSVSKTVTVDFVNIPNTQFVQKQAKSITIDIEASGYELLKMEFFSPNITIDVANEVEQTNGRYYWSILKNKKKIKNIFSNDVVILGYNSDKLQLDITAYVALKLPVKLQAEWSFKTNYYLKKGVEISPDSINVYGPANVLDTLQHVTTELIIRRNIQKTVNTTLAIETGLENLKFEKDSVHLTGEVVQYVHKELRVPIRIINLPEQKKVTTFPKEITITFLVPMSDYARLSPSDFDLISDYKKQQGSTLAVSLVNAPKFLKNLIVRQKDVEFILSE
jgi:hypothetical protein